MAKKKRSEVCAVSPSKTVVKWKSNKEYNDKTFLFSMVNYVAILPSVAATLVIVGAGPELYAAGGSYAAICHYFATHSGHRFATHDVLRKQKYISILESWKASKNKRQLLESYFIRHDRPFYGLVTKEQECSENIATHQVKTYLVRGFMAQHIEQEIEELPEFMWDKTLAFIDETMTKPVESLPVQSSTARDNPTMAVPMYDLIFNSNPIQSK